MLEAVESDLGRQWERETTVRVMTAYVAHELNHPLGTILNLVNTLSRHLAKPVVRPQDINEYLGSIKAEALRASTTIKHLRLLTERRPTKRSSIHLTDVCREAIDRLRPLADAKRVRLRLEVRTDQTQVKGVKELLGTALYNFLVNSIAALDDPAIAARKLMIRIVAETPDTTSVQVFDNGCGLPEDIRDKIFEPFVTTRADGSGLGLAIAGDIVRWHRGRVSCRSRRRGTCMEMILPNE
ncbi:MAG: HAMP domain-containing histidine kinase [Alphaproteobacteria bacterium]|nr:HAMP domain-containing histidine kinase [Alphaproteobacteria bacterium]MDE2630275.1 HAMP domain-containing histidine kinase [Alphaproteobacteria bacterium]